MPRVSRRDVLLFFFETKLLPDTGKCKVFEQTVAPTQRLQDSKINRVQGSPTTTPTVDPVEKGYSLGTRDKNIGMPSQYKGPMHGFDCPRFWA